MPIATIVYTLAIVLNNPSERAAEIADEIDALTAELYRLTGISRRDSRRRRLWVGARVLITRGDKYHLRKGILTGRHPNSDYWDIELDLLPGQTKKQVIWKTPSGFRVMRS